MSPYVWLCSYDASRGLSRLSETWVSQAAAQQRRGRAGRVAPGTCYRLWPSRMWTRLPAQQPPEVLRVPLQQLCLTTKATLAAAAAASSTCPSSSINARIIVSWYCIGSCTTLHMSCHMYACFCQAVMVTNSNMLNASTPLATSPHCFPQAIRCFRLWLVMQAVQLLM